jgi:hypothetical protein
VFTANHDAGVVQIAVFESPGRVVRPASSWALPTPGEFSYAHRSLGVTREAFEIGPLLGMAQLLTDPECKPVGISIVDSARPASEGLMSLQIGRRPGRTGTRAGRLFQPGRTRADDGLGPVGDMELCHDVGNVVPHCLGCESELGGDRAVVVSSPHHRQDLTLTIC